MTDAKPSSLLLLLPLLCAGILWADPADPALPELPAESASKEGLENLDQRIRALEGLVEDLQEHQRKPDTQASLLSMGRQVYREHCTACHGVNGNGQGPGARGLIAKPWDFTLGQYKFRTTVSGAIPRDEDLFRTISEGVPGTRMPSWDGLLTPRERMAAVQYIKSFSPRFVDEPLEEDDLVELPEQVPTSTPAAVARGRQVFQDKKCWECHGQTGRGDGPNSESLQDDRKLPIRPADFTRGVLKGGNGPIDIYRTIATGMNGTPMPSYAGQISEDDSWALAHYIGSLKEEPGWWARFVGQTMDE